MPAILAPACTGSIRPVLPPESNLQARPACHLRDSIEAHLTIGSAAPAVSRWLEDRAGWPVRKFVRTARRHRTIEIQAGAHTITATDPTSSTASTGVQVRTNVSQVRYP